jgi:Zn-dependent protease with chaperone function
MSFPGTYFDGLDIRGRRVEIEVNEGGGLMMRDADLQAPIPAGSFSLTSPLEGVPRFAHMADGVLEIPSSDEANSALGGLPFGPGRFSGAEAWLGSRVRVAAAVCATLVALCLAFIFKGLPAMARSIAFAVPAGIEGQIGWASQKALLKYQTSGQTPADRAVFARVNEQLGVLSRAAHTHLPMTPMAVNLALPNAFALPGGTVVVTTGLLRLGLTDDEISAVLAHELGHEELRHGIQSVLRQSSALIVVSVITGDLATLSSFSSSLPLLLINRGYSRDFEREADAYAVDLLDKVGIDPESLASALAKLEKASGTKKVASGYLSTHPGTEERIAAIHAAQARQGAGDYAAMIKRARFFERTNLASTVSLYRRAFRLRKPDPTDLYDAGVAAATIYDRDSAFPWLEEAVKGGVSDAKARIASPLLDRLHSDSRWMLLTAEAENYSAAPRIGPRAHETAE